MFYDGLTGLLHALVVGVLAYAVLVAFLRLSGSRTLAKLNAFDFVVTIALGSTLSSAILSADVSLVEGATAFVVLIGLQFLVSWLYRRVPALRSVVTARPVALVVDGHVRPAAMERERITPAEVRATLRQAGLTDLGDVAAVVLETDGTLSVIAGPPGTRGWALEGVEGLVD
jgi:uncharacterized membrane protein YcaP (DUF421 family)